MYNYCLDSSVYGGRFGGGGVSGLLLCAGETLQTMVFPQPVDKEKIKEEQFIKILLIGNLKKRKNAKISTDEENPT